MSPPPSSPSELHAIQSILGHLRRGQAAQGVQALRDLKDATHAAIPANLRIGRGITWVVQRLSALSAAACPDTAELSALAELLSLHIPPGDHLYGVPIFMMGQVGRHMPAEAFAFFEAAAASRDWVVREFAAGSFRQLIGPQKEAALPWLKQMVVAPDPNLRRFAGETLRPVTLNRWLNQEPEYSLSVLRLMFREAHPYPRTSVGNNLSDLSRRQPEMIFAILQQLVAMQDENSAWIAYRACRNLVKQDPQRVMDLLGVDEYHYKDRNFYRAPAPPG